MEELEKLKGTLKIKAHGLYLETEKGNFRIDYSDQQKLDLDIDDCVGLSASANHDVDAYGPQNKFFTGWVENDSLKLDQPE